LDSSAPLNPARRAYMLTAQERRSTCDRFWIVLLRSCRVRVLSDSAPAA
jgi:hypothetical protein